MKFDEKKIGSAVLLVLLLAMLTLVIFWANNRESRVGPEYGSVGTGGSSTVLDVAASGTPGATNVNLLDFTDGNFTVGESVNGTADIALANDISITGDLTVGGSAISDTFIQGDEFRFANSFTTCNSSIDHFVQTAPGELAFCARGNISQFVDTNGNGTNCVRYVGETSNLLAEICEGNQLRVNGLLRLNSQSVTCTDNSVGSSAQDLNLLPTHSTILLTVDDPDGCDVTLSETGMATGNTFTVINISSNLAIFLDMLNVQRLPGPAGVSLALYDNLSFIYADNQWIYTSHGND